MTWPYFYMVMHFLNINYIVEHSRAVADAGCRPHPVLLQNSGGDQMEALPTQPGQSTVGSDILLLAYFQPEFDASSI